MTTSRTNELRSWLAEQNPEIVQIQAILGDASTRFYFRCTLSDGSTRIAVDTPTHSNDNVTFLSIAELLQGSGLRVPAIEAFDSLQGFMLLEDLGQTSLHDLYLVEKNYTPASVPFLFSRVLAALQQLQTIPLEELQRKQITPYDHQFTAEMRLLTEWYLPCHLDFVASDAELKVLDEQFELITHTLALIPQTLMHRDFHSKNMMWTNQSELALIDFQGAVIGPITYDVFSFIDDIYIDLAPSTALDYVIRYWQIALKNNIIHERDFAKFYRLYEITGLQRYLKVLGLFVRLALRDKKPNYLSFLPKVLNRTYQIVARYPEFRPLQTLFARWHPTLAQPGHTF